LQTVLSNLREAIAESGAVITHEPLPSLRVDPTQMTVLVQNLISNALKFRGRASPKIHISAKHERNGWKIGVHDNGIGIAPEFHDRIFGMFKRLHSREEFEGSGIGLALCKKIVERHGGRIWVESVLKQGSTFFVAFPD
ncbi:MAG: sensor histidine kinase, partial [Hylemonella sp.]